ncbi:uncharacterized protein RMCC_1211 [Mycolicibacterium canariasense]|uniref:DUF202 domain-containing protein n=1 Tax=Mycolicibacterium canariasense TaxID=228230 RepID=A0A117I951_MYCCR|nr:DUF202 domain-containing protein [Mycolicibacterium canariasense]MCV7211924.1 DUF202 domain-containing protein [Mycolicibacterium canariasense]ORU98016.1 hypothetical protein AWB94_29045 [Mycolicibacterium canariasense]GAS94245.1 uncharacterized protein RMCC_1211 [Mycolicibacterium canariasense]
MRADGLQCERTQLSWERTAFGFLAVAVLLAFRARELPGWAHGLAAIALLAAGAAHRVRRGQLLGEHGDIAPARWAVPATGIVTAALGIACGAAVLW